MSAVAGVTATAGCISPAVIKEFTNGTENPYESVVRENIQALEEEDLELLKYTIHDDAPIYDRTIGEVKELWSEYDLTYELEEVEVIEQPESGGAAGAQALQIQQGSDCDGQSGGQALQIQQESDCAKEARVRFVQVTRKESGPEFRDNRIEGTHVLRRSEDDWKIWNTETENVEYL
jgi:hypothetical protein